MSITAKELAKKLGLSTAAVSLALNNRPGVSTKTRNHIISEAHKYGYDFSKIKTTNRQGKSISFIIYRKHGAVVSDTPFFSTLIDSITDEVKALGYKLKTQHVFEDEDIGDQLNSAIENDCSGILLLATEMRDADFFPFAYLNIPIVVLDSYFYSSKFDCIMINNVEGAFQATKYLINKRHEHPGHLKSSYDIYNFKEREEGFNKALRYSGMPTSNTITHLLSPSVKGAYIDMKAIIEQKAELATCYFADNDNIAIGAMRALKEAGYRIPQDVSIIGFDNLPFCAYVEPALTSMSVPNKYMGEIAVERLINVIESHKFLPIRLEVNPYLVKRDSIFSPKELD